MASPTDRPMPLETLARKAGVAARTIRYYIQRGLLPAPEFRGKDTTYTEAHLVRLKAIQRLQAAFLPLDEIRSRLDGLGLDAITRLAELPEPIRARPIEDAIPVRRESALTTGSLGTWRRHTVAPGLEIHIAEGAPPPVLRMAEDLLSTARKRFMESDSRRAPAPDHEGG